MTTDLSVVAPEVGTDPEPERHDQAVLDAVAALLPDARKQLVALRLAERYDAVELEGVTKRHVYGPQAKDGGRPVTLHEALYGESPADAAKRRAERGRDPLPRGEELRRAIEIAEAQIRVLEEVEAEQKALVESHKEWAKANDSFDASAYPADPAGQQMLVGMLDRQVQDIEERAEALLAKLEAAAEALPEADAA